MSVENNDKSGSCQALGIHGYSKPPCGRPLYDEKHCIFHSDKNENKSADFDLLFNDELKRQEKEDEYYDFTNFIFPNDISFNNIEFRKIAYFYFARFHGDKVDFTETKFVEGASFYGSKFYCDDIIFTKALFKVGGGFNHCEFMGRFIYFNGAKFSGKKFDFCNNEFPNVIYLSFEHSKFNFREVDFSHSNIFGKGVIFQGIEIISKKINFSGTNIKCENILFHESKLFGKEINFSHVLLTADNLSCNESVWKSNIINFMLSRFDVKRIRFINADISSEKIDLGGAIFNCEDLNLTKSKFEYKEINLLRTYFKSIAGLFPILTYKTKYLKRVKFKVKDLRFILGDSASTTNPLIKKMTEDAWYLSNYMKIHPYIYRIWKISSDCGRSILRWTVWSVLIVLLFAFSYMIIGPEAFRPRSYTWYSWIYYSVVTFTTLGFGDITPIKWYSEVIVTLEVIIGYIMLGGLISIFSNKLARRG